MTLDVAYRFIENMRMIVFQLLKRQVPFAYYVNSETLWIT